MGRRVNWEDQCEVEGGLVVRELGRRMVTEEWSMGEVAMVKESKVARREPTTSAWLSKNNISLECGQIQPGSS